MDYSLGDNQFAACLHDDSGRGVGPQAPAEAGRAQGKSPAPRADRGAAVKLRNVAAVGVVADPEGPGMTLRSGSVPAQGERTPHRRPAGLDPAQEWR